MYLSTSFFFFFLVVSRMVYIFRMFFFFFIAKWMPLINLRLLCAHNLGLCKCLWQAQSHKSSQRYSQKAGCCVQPNHGGCTIKRKTGENLIQYDINTYKMRFSECKGLHNSVQKQAARATHGQVISDITKEMMSPVLRLRKRL